MTTLTAHAATLPAASMFRMIMVVILGSAFVTTMVVGSTGAFFTDTQSVSANSFATGTVDISSDSASAVVALSDMAPGDVVTAPITLSNDGSLQLRYAVRSTTTEDALAAQLDLTIKSGVSTCTTGGFDTDGSVLYGAGDLGSTSGLDVIGDPTQGPDSGDRTLDAAAEETVCVQVLLPTSTGNAYQGLTTTATLEFVSEQTVNNG